MDWRVLLTKFLLPLGFLAVERVQAGRRYRWLTPSLVTDLMFGLFRVPLAAAVSAGIVAGGAWLIQTHLPFVNLGLLDGVPAGVQFVVYLVVFDFAYYVHHRLMHAFRVLWYVHAVHHSQEQLNPLTGNRGHPLEDILAESINVLTAAALGGAPPVIFWFAMADHLWSYFVHCDLRVNLGPLKYVLVTPQYHRVHHSRERVHFDKNFAGRLILFDWLFGTLHPRFDEYPATGVNGYPVRETSAGPAGAALAATRHMLYPLVAIWRYYVRPEPPRDPSPPT